MGYLVLAKYVISDKVLEDAAVAINGDVVEEVGDSTELTRRFRGYERIDAGKSVIIPGLINTHTHAAMTIFRGYAEELTLEDWLEKIWPVEAKLNGDAIYLGAKLAAAEALLFGTTTINSMYFYRNGSSEPQAFRDAGIRAVVAHTIFEWTRNEALRTSAQLVKKWHGAQKGRIRVAIAPHAPYTVSPDTLQEAKRLADELNKEVEDAPIIMRMHLAETSDEPKIVHEKFGADTKEGVARYLESLGLLSENFVAAHCIHLSDRDYASLNKHHVSVSTNPISNLKVGMGVASVTKLLQNGINVSLGTDSAASNNALDMFETMKMASILQKGVSGDPRLAPAKEVFEMATVRGGLALKAERSIGRVAKGFKADLAVVDLKKPHATPFYDLFSHLVYSAKCGDVKHVFVDGRLVVEGGRIMTVDLEDLFRRIERLQESLFAE